MLQDIAEYLVCPHCGADLALDDGRALRCAAGHSFDVARQGYASLLPGDAHTGTGDTAAMVAARDAFLSAGHYAPIAGALAQAAADALDGAPAGGCVADLGAGTGYYLAAVLDRLPGRPGAALDISKYALRRAARSHPRVGAVVCDAWRPLPLRDASAALMLNVFAPRGGPEIRRVLRPGGTLLVVSPTGPHLRELVGPLGLLSVDEDKDRRIAEKLGPHLAPGERREVRWTLTLSRSEAAALVAMGPSAWHTDPERLAGPLAALPDPVEVTAAVTIAAYQRL
ncbi:putative RNA methyltransferase [Streptomyces sp. NPDC092296]|uniref:putative RNA methyltransferase n=1 Tax=Streptomyces sp. NPDC092296 TaxID=3366012 RepID=UPI00381EC4C4